MEFIDPDMVDITETCSIGGLRTLSVEYNIQELENAKKLFKLGNKLWVHGEGVTDCLYVINTKVKQALFKDNKFTFDAEEVLVELNYAPLFKQIDLTTANGFTISNVNGEQAVTINWNALNYWFGNYFNIGVVQDCLNTYVAKVPLSGTMSLMNLLRKIEEETGNFFVTRYEKDMINNTIHRYLDFLNPHSTNKNWELNLEYDFLNQENTSYCYDENGNVIDEEPEAAVDDPPVFKPNVPVSNINPENILFRVTKDGENLQGLQWDSSRVGFIQGVQNAVISLKYKGNKLGVQIYSKAFPENEGNSVLPQKGYVEEWVNQSYNTTVENGIDVALLDGSCFEIYDHVNDQVIFKTEINSILSEVHEDVLDLGYNVENIDFEVDETDTYTAVSPVLSLSTSEDKRNSLSRTDMDKIIDRWKRLHVEKGEIIPMILQKFTITGTESRPCIKRTGAIPDDNARTAEEILGTYNLHTNYYVRPYKPQDSTEETNKSYEYWRAVAYWKAPFTKNAGEMHVSLDKNTNIEYEFFCGRPDIRDERADILHFEKMGFTETSEEDRYAIYNAVVNYLKNHKDPEIDLTVDVANLRNKQYNEYNVHDKVYVKLPGSEELITAKVDSTSKTPNNIAENKVKLSNYSIQTKVAPQETYISASNMSFKYPAKKVLTAKLLNADYDENDLNTVAKLSNKLVSFTTYKVKDGSVEATGRVFTRKTNNEGEASLTLGFTPGDYEVEIKFGGDAEYEETSLTIEVNVSGTIQKANQTKNTSKTKTTTKTIKSKTTSKTTKTIKTYWSKCGLSPDKKQIIAIAQPSAGDGNYPYKLHKTIFKNYCPECGKEGTLRFDGGSANKCITSTGAYGRGYKIDVPEHEITCIHCDSDFDGVTGLEKDWSHSTRLKRLKDPVSSSQSEFNTLVKGKLQFGTQKVTVKSKTKVTSKTYNNHQSGISKAVKKKAISIAGGTTGFTALKKVAAYMGKVKYAYDEGFVKSSASVLSSNRGNCCDQTRLMLEMMDVVDTENEFKLEYVFVCCNSSNGVGHVFAKVTTKASGNWRYVDPCKNDPWGNYVTGWGEPPGRRTVYPERPF